MSARAVEKSVHVYDPLPVLGNTPEEVGMIAYRSLLCEIRSKKEPVEANIPEPSVMVASTARPATEYGACPINVEVIIQLNTDKQISTRRADGLLSNSDSFLMTVLENITSVPLNRSVLCASSFQQFAVEICV
jgi:hypothetical protein